MPSLPDAPAVHPENPLVGRDVKARPPAGSATGADSAAAIAGNVVDVKRRACDGRVLAFVRWRDFERRFGEWVPVDNINRESLPVDASSGEPDERCRTPTTTLWTYSGIEDELRTGFKNTVEFLEERLRRDMKSPNSVHRLHYAGHVMAPWFFSPFSTLYPQFSPSSGLLHDAYVCPFTLAPFESAARLTRHLHAYVRSGAPLQVPGREIYCDDEAGLSLMELDGRQHTVFCRNVFLLAKCFLECKLVGHDTDLYTVYVVAVHANKRAAGFFRGLPAAADGSSSGPKIFAGYYSYERGSVDNNLACIVTLPCFQGHGLGRFLIEASYAVGYRKGIVGSPERPLSELGRAAYDRYWSEKVWRWVMEEAVGAVEQRRPVQPAAYDAPSNADLDTSRSKGEADGSAGDNESGAGPDGADTGALAVMRVTTHDVAKKLRLDASDVLETVLRLGLVHRTEGRALKLLVPPALAAHEIDRVRRTAAPFRAELLRGVTTTGGSD